VQDAKGEGEVQQRIAAHQEADRRRRQDPHQEAHQASDAWVGFNDMDTEGTYLWTDDTTLAASLFVPVPFDGNGDADDCGLFYNNVNAPGKWYTYSCSGGFGYSYVEFDCSAAL
jgi:Lectin C-type domain